MTLTNGKGHKKGHKKFFMVSLRIFYDVSGVSMNCFMTFSACQKTAAAATAEFFPARAVSVSAVARSNLDGAGIVHRQRSDFAASRRSANR
jgi:hypothetical protein